VEAETMSCQKDRLRSAIALTVSLSTLLACAHEEPQSTFPPPPAEVRESLTAVAVVPASCEAKYEIPTPVKGGGSGAASGATQGALWGATPGLAFCAIPPHIGCGLGAPAAIAGAIVGAIPGAIVGVAKAHSAEEVTAAETTLRQIITETSADEILADRIIVKARETGMPERIEPADKTATPEDLAKQGFTSALWVTVDVCAFSEKALFADDPIDPSVRMATGAQVRIETFGQPDTWSRKWFYRGEDTSFFDLAAKDGQRLREDIDTALTAIAAKVVNDIFISNATETLPTLRTYADLPSGIVRPNYYTPGLAK
jgi:uncharacterized membrane protein